MKITTSTGIELDSEGGLASSLTGYALNKKLKNAVVFLANDKGYQSYLLVINNEPEFESQKSEDVAVHIDILSLKEACGREIKSKHNRKLSRVSYSTTKEDLSKRS